MDTERHDDGPKSFCLKEGNTLVFRILSPVDDKAGEDLDRTGRAVLDSGETAYVLIDLSGSSSFSNDARKRWVDFLQHSHITKTAIFGGSTLVRVIATIVISASKKKNIAYFATDTDARTWLAT